MQEKSHHFYVRDYLWLALLGLVCLTADLTNNLRSEGLNAWAFYASFAFLSFEGLKLVYKFAKNWIGHFRNYGRSLFKNTAYLILSASFMCSPFLNLFDGVIIPMEGVWNFCLLTLSLQPLRAVMDNLSDNEDGILRVIKNDNPFNDLAA